MISEIKKEDFPFIQKMGLNLNKKFDINNISNNEKIYKYKVDKNIVGFIQIYKLYEVMDIINIYVDDKYRKRGIATKLMKYTTDKFLPKRIMLEVNVNNSIAISFYKKNGFKVIRTIKNYYNGIDAYSMERCM